MENEKKRRGRRPNPDGARSVKSGTAPTYCLVATLAERQFDSEFSKRYNLPKAKVWHAGHEIARLLMNGEVDIKVLRGCLPISRNPVDFPKVGRNPQPKV